MLFLCILDKCTLDNYEQKQLKLLSEKEVFDFMQLDKIFKEKEIQNAIL